MACCAPSACRLRGPRLSGAARGFLRSGARGGQPRTPQVRRRGPGQARPGTPVAQVRGRDVLVGLDVGPSRGRRGSTLLFALAAGTEPVPRPAITAGPFAHLTKHVLGRVNRARGDAIRAQLLANLGPVLVPAPTPRRTRPEDETVGGTCFACGLGSIEVSAADAEGLTPAVLARRWAPVGIPQGASLLGAPASPHTVRAVLCPAGRFPGRLARPLQAVVGSTRPARPAARSRPTRAQRGAVGAPGGRHDRSRLGGGHEHEQRPAGRLRGRHRGRPERRTRRPGTDSLPRSVLQDQPRPLPLHLRRPARRGQPRTARGPRGGAEDLWPVRRASAPRASRRVIAAMQARSKTVPLVASAAPGMRLGNLPAQRDRF